MTEADKIEFVEILTALAVMKPGAKLTKESHKLWWSAMQGWSIEEFRSGANHLARSVEFMPSPYHFEKLRKAGVPTAGEAWVQVLAHVRHGEYGRSVLASNIERVVRMLGGWKVIATHETEKLHFLERRFCEHYEDLQDAEDVREALPQLTGTPEPHLPAPVAPKRLVRS